jgi:hypothetical protein
VDVKCDFLSFVCQPTLLPKALFAHLLSPPSSALFDERLLRYSGYGKSPATMSFPTKSGPVSVEQEIGKDLDRLMAARCSNQLTDKELAQANIDTACRLTATSDPRLREIGQLLIDCGQF